MAKKIDYWQDFFSFKQEIQDKHDLFLFLMNDQHRLIRHSQRVARNIIILNQDSFTNEDIVVALLHDYAIADYPEKHDWLTSIFGHRVTETLFELCILNFDFDDTLDGYNIEQDIKLALEEESELYVSIEELGKKHAILKIAHRIQCMEEISKLSYKAIREEWSEDLLVDFQKLRYYVANTRRFVMPLVRQYAPHYTLEFHIRIRKLASLIKKLAPVAETARAMSVGA